MVQFPHAWRHAVAEHLVGAANGIPTSISPDPDAQLFGADFTHLVAAAAAGPIACMLRAPGLRALKAQVLDAAVAATLAREHHDFYGMLR